MKNAAIISMLLVILVAGFQKEDAQLAHTKWAGIFNIPAETACFLDFKTDTVDMILSATGEVLEVMKFNLKGDTVFFQKIYGGSPCGTDETGIYRYTISQGKLQMTIISDECPARSSAGFDQEMMLVTEPPRQTRPAAAANNRH